MHHIGCFFIGMEMGLPFPPKKNTYMHTCKYTYTYINTCINGKSNKLYFTKKLVIVSDY